MKDFFSNVYVVGIILGLINLLFRKYLEPKLPSGKVIVEGVKPIGDKIVLILTKFINYGLGYVVPCYVISLLSVNLYNHNLDSYIGYSVVLLIFMIFMIIFNFVSDLKRYKVNLRK
jgi:hypothetical protein